MIKSGLTMTLASSISTRVCIPMGTMDLCMSNLFINLIFLYLGGSSYPSGNLSLKNALSEITEYGLRPSTGNLH